MCLRILYLNFELTVAEPCHENTKERKERELENVLGLQNNCSQLSMKWTEIPWG